MTNRQRHWIGEFVLEWLIIGVTRGVTRLLGGSEAHLFALSTGARIAIAVPLTILVTTLRTNRAFRRKALQARR